MQNKKGQQKGQIGTDGSKLGSPLICKPCVYRPLTKGTVTRLFGEVVIQTRDNGRQELSALPNVNAK